jgi:hypothetical protein
VEGGLIELGFRVKRHALDEVRDELRTHGGSVASVSVPIKQYDALVAEWNALLARAEDQFDESRIAHEAGTGASIKADLAPYRKVPLQDGTESAAPNAHPLSQLPTSPELQTPGSLRTPFSGRCG